MNDTSRSARVSGARRSVLRALVACALVSVLVAQGGAMTDNWQTVGEQTGFKKTATYEQTVDFCRRLAAASPDAFFTSFGTSPQGRELPLLVLSREQAFTPEAARKTGKAIVLVQNGIHSGEIDGKEASLALARDIVVRRTHEELLGHAILLVVPIFNVDGHERSSPYNRINQDGPEAMGWRATAQNLNLNRDYLKADAPEMRALLALFNAWSPDLFVDTHVTDGADFQYDMLYTLESTGYVAPSVSEYVTTVFQPHVRPALEREGHVVDSYFTLRDSRDPAKGIERMVFTPRFSNGYGALRNRPTILVETHMLKPFGTRTKATYDLLVETMREVNRDPGALREAVRKADSATVKLGAAYDPSRRLPLRLAIGDSPHPFRFRGVEYRTEASDISGASRVIYGTTPRDFDVDVYDTFEVTASVAPPLAYVVPAEWTDVVDRLRAHGIAFERTTHPVSADFETYRLEDPRWSPSPFEGRHPVRFTVRPVVENRTLPAGSIVVRLDQPLAKVAVHLLEPEAPDSLAVWGLFDSVFEQKEYGEGYVLEELARKMLAADPELRKEFEARLATDAEFRNSAYARLDFFYRRSPYWDARIGAYPVVRITSARDLESLLP